MITITYEPEKNRTAAYDGDSLVGECIYSVVDKSWSLDHTFVDENYGGQGIAGKLVEELVKQAKEKQVKIIPVCSFAKKEFGRKEEYAEVLLK